MNFFRRLTNFIKPVVSGVAAVGMMVLMALPVMAGPGDAFQAYYDSFELTDEEKAYIVDHPVVRVGYIGDMEPVSYKKGSQFRGYQRGFMDLISNGTGLRFEYVELPESTRIAPISLRSSNIDVLVGMDATSVGPTLNKIVTTDAYYSCYKVVVAKSVEAGGTSGKKAVAVPFLLKTLEEGFTVEHPNYWLETREDVDACFKSVKNGVMPATMVNQYVAVEMLSKSKYKGLQIVPQTEELRYDECLGLVPGTLGDDPELLSILNKAVGAITPTLAESIVIREVATSTKSGGAAEFISTYRYVAIAGLLIIGTMAVLLIMLYRARRQEKLERIRRKEDGYLQDRRYRLIVDESDDVIFEINTLANTCMNTERMKRKFNWSFPTVLNNYEKEHFETLWLMPDEDRPKVKAIFEGAISSKLHKTETMRIKTSAHDYLWCRVTMHPLMNKDGDVVSVIGKIVDIDSQIKEKRWLEMRSKMDGLTGLLNKVSFQTDVAEYLDTHPRTATALIFLDMDHFKALNDTLGHMIGDKAIRDVAFSLTKIFGENDFISRFGGDEFCVFAMDITRDKLIEKLEKALAAMTLTYTDDSGQSVTLTASIGAVYNMDSTATFRQLIEAADNKLYEAKENGRNRYVLTIRQ